MAFSEAALVFTNPLARIFADEEHSVEEQREIMVGHSPANRLLVISFAEAGPDVVRIISARDATKQEQQDYEENV